MLIYADLLLQYPPEEKGVCGAVVISFIISHPKPPLFLYCQTVDFILNTWIQVHITHTPR
jgi:hypothetical protein